MFCPKCGIENPENGKFCRSCGANLSNVLAVVDGTLSDEEITKNSPAELFSSGVRNIVLGFGFLAAAVFLFMIPPRDGIFWLMMMIPGFCLLASGIGRILKSDSVKKEVGDARQLSLSTKHLGRELPPSQTDYIKPQSSIYETDDLTAEPRSVTENTTRHLKMNSEGETMTLSKKQEN